VILPADFVFSQNSLQDYSDCARRFQLRYLKHLAWPAIEAEPVIEHERKMRVGSLFHRMVHQHILGIPLERLGQDIEDPDLAVYWSNYTQFLPANRSGRRLSELILSIPIEGFRLVAKYDLVVLAPDGQATILDWKTGSRLPKRTSLEKRIQTRVYRYVLHKAGALLSNGGVIAPEHIEFVYWYAGFPTEKLIINYNTSLAVEDKDLLEELVTDIASRKEDDFPMTDDEKKCAFCVYRSHCERGDVAGALADIELDDELAVTDALDFDFEQIAEIEF
jgi:hypothetical protein